MLNVRTSVEMPVEESQDGQGVSEIGQGRASICTFEGALACTDLEQLCGIDASRKVFARRLAA